MKTFTKEELKGFNGSDSSLPILISINGHVFDVSTSKKVYGPGGTYHPLAGHEVAYALAVTSLEPNDIASPPPLSTLEGEDR